MTSIIAVRKILEGALTRVLQGMTESPGERMQTVLDSMQIAYVRESFVTMFPQKRRWVDVAALALGTHVPARKQQFCMRPPPVTSESQLCIRS